ncbi:MAG: MotA/TolQ/ExbB proton channel family protein [Gammaproteobacteria bacterium]|nr:MotA/TolQ/ExbB proton channel family protein [Gammaproteobacteria bacterium]
MNWAYRTFVMWLIWGSAATTIYLGLYLDTDILEFFRQDQSRITWIITALFLFGVAISLLLTLMVTAESVEAVHQQELAQRDGLMALQPSHPRKKRSVNNFYSSLKIVAANNESPDIDSLLNMEFAFYLRISHAIDVLGNLLITLGLIGTVVGLTYTLTGLTTSLNALGTDQDLLLEGLRKAMGGMGTAFYTTLLGAVLGGVLLRIFALITENGISSLHDFITKTCMIHLSADFKPTVERDVRFLNVEIEALGERLKTLQLVFHDSKSSLVEFHNAVKDLYKLSGEEKDTTSLRETLRLQRYYRELLRQEMQLMQTLNRTWWQRFKEYVAPKKNPKQ